MVDEVGREHHIHKDLLQAAQLAENVDPAQAPALGARVDAAEKRLALDDFQKIADGVAEHFGF